MGVLDFLCTALVSCMQLNVSKDEGTASFQPCQSCGSARLQKLASLPADLLVERVHQGRHIGAEVRPSVVPALPAQGRGVPAGHWDVFVAAQAKLPLLQALEKLWRSYRIHGCADMSSYLGTLSVLPPRLLLLPNTVLFLESITYFERYFLSFVTNRSLDLSAVSSQASVLHQKRG